MTPTGERVEQLLPIAEILDHVAAGRRCAIVDVTRTGALTELARVTAAALEHREFREHVVTRVNGKERLSHPAGGFVVAGVPEYFRGLELDVAYAPIALRLSPELEAHLMPALADTNGELVWWER